MLHRGTSQPYARAIAQNWDSGKRVLACWATGRGLAELARLKDEKNPAKPQRLTRHQVTPEQPVPDHIPKPVWYDSKERRSEKLPTEVHDEQGIAKMRAVGKLAAQVLADAGALVKPGVTTDEIDKAVHEMTIAAGAYPSPLRYGKPPFPKSVCTSVNECVCHGVPDQRPLQDGDIVNIDVTVYLDGYHGDTSRTFTVGEVPEKAKKLIAATKGALDAAIAICKPGTNFQEIGKAVTAFTRSQTGPKERPYAISEEFIGHGVGKNFHASPWVFHFENREREGVMEVGQTFTIEPILHEPGGSPRYRTWRDGWTVVARDGSLSAQFEHTLLITETGVDILTAYE